jgi:hypothetical protein
MSLKEQVVREIDHLPESALQQLVEYMAFLKFRARRTQKPHYNVATLEALYAECAEEDRQLAEEGLEEYVRALNAEDAA